MMLRPRRLAQFLAAIGGYFWMPCPICRKPFAGFECGSQGLELNPGYGECVCSKSTCQAEAIHRSDEMYARHGMKIVRS